jgi:hypothetical protein
MHLPLPFLFSQHRPCCPLHHNLFLILQNVVHGPVQHHLVAVIPKWEDLLDAVLAFGHWTTPEAVAELEDLVYAC